MLIKKKNIRATALNDFWGDEYEEFVYLWEGAKNNGTLTALETDNSPVLEELFATRKELVSADQYCKKIYFQSLSKISEKLNKIHKLDLPTAFWQASFGSWLFRHICLVFDKYKYLSKFNIDQTSIRLLKRNSFYIPNDFFDYSDCFLSDFGVQQLVSQYYSLFTKKPFPSISKTWSHIKKRGELYHHINLIIDNKEDDSKKMERTNGCETNNPQVAICCAYYTEDFLNTLSKTSNGEIQWMDLPKVHTYQTQIRRKDRKGLSEIESRNNFERFLFQTLEYCFPKIFIEHFIDYYDQFTIDITNKKFTHIVSEVWAGFFPVSIYLAIAQYLGRKLIFQQHGVSTQWRLNNHIWMELSVADKFLTTGWKNVSPKVIQGGFACREPQASKFDSKGKQTILYISNSTYLYRCSFGCISANKEMAEYLLMVRDFIDLLPDDLKKYFALRPKRLYPLWDTERVWNIDKKNIKTAEGNFSDIISEARIVIIDHLSTGIAEILFNNIPCLIIHNDKVVPLSEEYTDLFEDLIKCGVVHNSAKSAVQQLINVYNDVEQWWFGDAVQDAVKKIVTENLSPPSKTMNYLLSCLKRSSGKVLPDRISISDQALL